MPDIGGDRQIRASAARRFERMSQGGIAQDLMRRAIESRLIDTALAIASRLFVAIIPLALLVTALLPEGETFAQRLVDGMQLEGTGRDAAIQLFATPEAVRAGITLTTLVVVTYAVISCGGVIQRMYEVIWQLDTRNVGRFVADFRARTIWALGFMLFIAALFAAPEVSGDSDFGKSLDVVGVTLAVMFFAWTPYILLDRRIQARKLIPTALLTTGSLGLVTAIAPIYVARLASVSAERYGLVGFAFAFLTWLFAQAFLLVASGVVGATIADRDGRHPLDSENSADAGAPSHLSTIGEQ